MVLDAQSVESLKLLILTDGKKGHENQSIAYANLLGYEYVVCKVTFSSKWRKSLSYLLDFLSLHVKIFSHSNLPKKSFDCIVCTGSTTYYPAKVLGKKLGLPIIALMLPRGYKLADFKQIFALNHDNPPNCANITPLHVNISQNNPEGIFKATKPTLGIIIGGSNSHFTCSVHEIKNHFKSIAKLFPEHDLAITTSPRTNLEIDDFIQSINCKFKIIYSQNPQNPVGDFLENCTDVCISEDSTSMLSQAICWGTAKVHIMPLKSEKEDNKYHRFANFLVQNGYASWLGEPSLHVKKYELKTTLNEAKT